MLHARRELVDEVVQPALHVLLGLDLDRDAGRGRIVVSDDEILVSGSGYSPEGEKLFEDEGAAMPSSRGQILALVHAGILCNDAYVRKSATG